MKYFSAIVLLVFLSRCSGRNEEKVVEEISAEKPNDTSGIHETAVEEKTNTDSLAFAEYKIDSKLSFEKKAEEFIVKYKFLYSETELNKMIIPERYENTYMKKIALKKNTPVNYGKVENVYPVAQLWFFKYKDSVSCRNVINNWLQCYGFDCTPVEFMVDLPAIKTTPSMAILNKDGIVFLQYQCEHTGNNWNDMKRELINLFADRGAGYILTLSDCGKKLVWQNNYPQ